MLERLISSKCWVGGNQSVGPVSTVYPTAGKLTFCHETGAEAALLVRVLALTTDKSERIMPKAMKRRRTYSLRSDPQPFRSFNNITISMCIHPTERKNRQGRPRAPAPLRDSFCPSRASSLSLVALLGTAKDLAKKKVYKIFKSTETSPIARGDKFPLTFYFRFAVFVCSNTPGKEERKTKRTSKIKDG